MKEIEAIHLNTDYLSLGILMANGDVRSLEIIYENSQEAVPAILSMPLEELQQPLPF